MLTNLSKVYFSRNFIGDLLYFHVACKLLGPWARSSCQIHLNTFFHKGEREIHFNNENKGELFGMLFSQSWIKLGDT